MFYCLAHSSDNLSNLVLLRFFVGVASGVGPRVVALLVFVSLSTSRRVLGFALLLVHNWSLWA